ncbi:hypothetical protein [Microbacterium sp. C7(2022)]|uniref:hypothetical protein n=1 Tax=Microbacterium sp. C7(2022) TaxID=2992759 RepID=UPI00237B6517|nr:hypothetical protein [Microbacterium sp. C7(2022)]MDE0545367.1 hypothetical protein [Microbacterium sp. C7(2022)]
MPSDPLSSDPLSSDPLPADPFAAPAFRPGEVLWSRVEDGFHVANAGGVFLGYIDREADASYRVFDGRSRLVGRAPGRREAMDMLTTHQPGPSAGVAA